MVVLLRNLLHKEQLATWVAICLDDIKVDGHGPMGLGELIIVHMLYLSAEVIICHH